MCACFFMCVCVCVKVFTDHNKLSTTNSLTKATKQTQLPSVTVACDWSGVFIFWAKSHPPPTFRLWLSPWQDGQMEDIQYLYNDGIPFGQEELHTHTHNTHRQITHTCQRALPADELGHFSFSWLRGLQCVVSMVTFSQSCGGISPHCRA